MCGHFLGVLERPAVGEAGGDARRPTPADGEEVLRPNPKTPTAPPGSTVPIVRINGPFTVLAATRPSSRRR